MSAEAGPSSKPHKSKKRHSEPGSKPKKDKSHKAAAPAVAASAPAAKGDGLSSPFKTVRTSIRLSIPPVFAMDLKRGAEELLDSLVMRYSPQLSAVLLAYSNIHFPDIDGTGSAGIVNDCPFAVTEVGFDAIVWAPRVGMKLSGSHSISTASHISLILYKTFNVSIPLPHIPLDLLEFDESAVAEQAEDDGMELTEEEEEEREEIEEGRWRRKQGARELLGKEGEEIVFTVVALHVSNEMLSLTGSLLANPSDPSIPTSTITFTKDAYPAAPGSQLARERAAVPSNADASSSTHTIGESLVAPAAHISGQKTKKASRKSAVETTNVDAQPAPAAPAAPVTEDPFQALGKSNQLEKEKDKAEKKARRKAEKAAAKAAEAAPAAAPAAPVADDDEEDEKTDRPVAVAAREAQAKVDGEVKEKSSKKKKRALEEGVDGSDKKKKRKKE